MKAVLKKKKDTMRKNWRRSKKPKTSQMSQENGLVSIATTETPGLLLEQTRSGSLLSATSPRRKTCSTLKYWIFIEVYVQEDYDRIGGKQVWDDIIQEYAGLIKTDEVVEAFDLWRQIEYNEWRLSVAETAISYLRDIYSAKGADALVEAGFSYIENLQDEKTYQKQLDFVTNETSSVVVVLNQLKTRYDKMFPPSEGEKPKRTEIDFDKELAILAKHGYKVNKRKQSVMEYCAAVNAFYEEQKRLKASIKKK